MLHECGSLEWSTSQYVEVKVTDNPWVDRILDELVRWQSRNQDAKYRPVGLMGLRLTMLSDANPVDVISWDGALQELSNRGLIEVRGRNLVELTDRGWRETKGSVPGGEKDEPFLVGVLDALEDDSVRKNNTFVSADTVYQRLHWPFDAGEAHALANRLERQGFAKAHLTMGNALVRLEYGGVRAAQRLREKLSTPH